MKMHNSDFLETIFTSEDWRKTQTLLVFGYGSLIWKPSFAYDRREFGYICGFARRFWQGNVTHRGIPEAPGRVATLVEDELSETWGAVYHLRGRQQVETAMKHLVTREMTKGGYHVTTVKVFLDSTRKGNSHLDNVLVFMATPENTQYLGPAPVDTVARTVVSSRGRSGHNLEYVFNLIDALRNEEPRGLDPHLASLEDACLHHLAQLAIHCAAGCHAKCRSAETTECNLLLDTNATEDPYVLKCIQTRLRHNHEGAKGAPESGSRRNMDSVN